MLSVVFGVGISLIRTCVIIRASMFPFCVLTLGVMRVVLGRLILIDNALCYHRGAGKQQNLHQGWENDDDADYDDDDDGDVVDGGNDYGGDDDVEMTMMG